MRKYMNVVKVKVEPNICLSGQNDTFWEPDCYPEFPVLLTNLSFPKWPISLEHPSSNDSLLGGLFFRQLNMPLHPGESYWDHRKSLVSDFDEENHPTAVTDVMKFSTPSLASVWIWPFFLFLGLLCSFVATVWWFNHSRRDVFESVWRGSVREPHGHCHQLSKLGLENTFWVIWIRLSRSLRCPQKPAGHA